MITSDQKKQIIALTIKGLTNRAIAEELGMYYATVCYWKAEFKRQGIVLPIKMGRPKGTGSQPTTEMSKEMFDSMTPENQEIYKQQEYKRIMAIE